MGAVRGDPRTGAVFLTNPPSTEKPLSGRFVYQVRWPDGTVRKGPREIAPFDDVLFKKVGS